MYSGTLCVVSEFFWTCFVLNVGIVVYQHRLLIEFSIWLVLVIQVSFLNEINGDRDVKLDIWASSCKFHKVVTRSLVIWWHDYKIGVWFQCVVIDVIISSVGLLADWRTKMRMLRNRSCPSLLPPGYKKSIVDFPPKKSSFTTWNSNMLSRVININWTGIKFFTVNIACSNIQLLCLHHRGWRCWCLK